MTSYRIAWETDLSRLLSGPHGRVFLTGMGGSSLPGDLVNDYLGGNPRLFLIRDYRIPDHVHPEDLMIASSFSGNTEETLAAWDEALKRNIPTVALTNGGELKKRATAKGLPWIPIPDCIQPRCANGYFFAAILALLEKLGRIPPQEKGLGGLTRFLEERQAAQEQTGRDLAAALVDKVPLVYGPPELEGTCRVWKIKINENAKVQSFSNVFPELNHNEMVGFTRLIMKPAIVYLKSRLTHPRILKRMAVMEELLRAKMPFFSVELQGADHLQEMFDSLAVADYATYYLAKAYGIDPAPVEMVEEFKKKL